GDDFLGGEVGGAASPSSSPDSRRQAVMGKVSSSATAAVVRGEGLVSAEVGSSGAALVGDGQLHAGVVMGLSAGGVAAWDEARMGWMCGSRLVMASRLVVMAWGSWWAAVSLGDGRRWWSSSR
ncbi:hypothetical protein Dimus_015860, partial [Dionaea muscipula]